MNSPNQLVPLSNLEDLNLIEERFGYSMLQVSENNPIGKRAVFKCKDVSISEVFGYLLARLLGVPVAEFQGVWFEKKVETPEGYRAPVNHIGILIEYLPSLCPIHLEQLATSNKVLVAKVLSFCFFDRFEWPQVFRSPTSIYVLDLERIGPVMLVDEFECTSGKSTAETLSWREDQYSRTSQNALNQILCQADQLHVMDELCEELHLISEISHGTLQQKLSIKGHPYSRLLSSFFLSAVSKRQAVSSAKVGVCPWPLVEWHSEIS